MEREVSWIQASYTERNLVIIFKQQCRTRLHWSSTSAAVFLQKLSWKLHNRSFNIMQMFQSRILLSNLNICILNFSPSSCVLPCYIKQQDLK